MSASWRSMGRRRPSATIGLLLVLLGTAFAQDAALAPDSIELVLAASWQPGFCASDAGRDKPECRSLTADRFDATHFALHGLWPDDLDDAAIFPCYCDRGPPRSCERSLPPDPNIDLSPDVLGDLSVVMPGVRSGLHRHQWTKHGTCYEDDKSGEDVGADPDEYFTEAMALLIALNASAVRALFADRRGEVLTRQEIEAEFNEAFGAGADDRVVVRCSGRGANRIITELRINLAGNVTRESYLADLILAAPPTSVSSNSSSCGRGRVAGTN